MFLILYFSCVRQQVCRTFCHVANQYCYLRMLMTRREGGAARGSEGDRDLLPAAAFTWPAFRWAVATAMTRQNLIPAVSCGPGKGDITNAMALIPVYDLINHAQHTDPATARRMFRLSLHYFYFWYFISMLLRYFVLVGRRQCPHLCSSGRAHDIVRTHERVRCCARRNYSSRDAHVHARRPSLYVLRQSPQRGTFSFLRVCTAF